MSKWFTDIAGKAEELLNQIDKNAADALTVDENNANANDGALTEVVSVAERNGAEAADWSNEARGGRSLEPVANRQPAAQSGTPTKRQQQQQSRQKNRKEREEEELIMFLNGDVGGGSGRQGASSFSSSPSSISSSKSAMGLMAATATPTDDEGGVRSEDPGTSFFALDHKRSASASGSVRRNSKKQEEDVRDEDYDLHTTSAASAASTASSASSRTDQQHPTLVSMGNFSAPSPSSTARTGTEPASTSTSEPTTATSATDHFSPLESAPAPALAPAPTPAPPRLRQHEQVQKNENSSTGSGSVEENQLLRSEITSLNQEMNQVLCRAKSAEKALADSRAESARLAQAMKNGSRRVQELERELLERERQTEQVREELREQEAAALKERKVGREQLENVEQRLREREEQLQQQEEQMAKNDTAMTESIKVVEQERGRLRSRVESLQEESGRKQTRISELTSALSAGRAEVDGVRQQHDEYKAKAKKVLWEKEKLIETLRGAAGQNRWDDGEMEEAELQQAIRERDLLRDESQQLTDQMSSVKADLAQLEGQLQLQLQLSSDCRAEAAEAVNEARAQAQEAEQDLQRVKEDLRYLQEDFTHQKTHYASAVHEREEELASLRSQLLESRAERARRLVSGSGGGVSMGNTGSGDNMEARVTQLTETLLQKQALLEAVSAEKTSLVLQIERMEEQAHESQQLLYRGHAATGRNGVGGVDADHLEPRPPSFLQENPFDTGVTRRVKRAYSSIDKLSCRIGATLRRYPMARIFVLAYMTLLHFWVFLILFHAAPDPNRR